MIYKYKKKKKKNELANYFYSPPIEDSKDCSTTLLGTNGEVRKRHKQTLLFYE